MKPTNHLHVQELRSGQEWIMPLKPNSLCDLKTQIKNWAKNQFGGELRLDGEIVPKLYGDYYGEIILDGRLWEGAGFYLKSTY